MDTISVTAIRSVPRTKREREVTVTFQLKHGDHGDILAITDGGVTGYESFYVADMLRLKARDGSNDFTWTACAGTPGLWDKLVVPDSSMRKVFDAFGIKP